MSPDLLRALQSMDPTNDDHWTGDGLPKLEVVRSALGREISRSELSKESKGFSRKNSTLPSTNGEAGAIGTSENADAADVANASTSDDVADALTKADQAVAAAQKLQKVAYDAMTEVAGARLVRTTTEQADDIKAFQKAQQAQREGTNEQTKLFASVLANQAPQPK